MQEKAQLKIGFSGLILFFVILTLVSAQELAATLDNVQEATQTQSLNAQTGLEVLPNSNAGPPSEKPTGDFAPKISIIGLFYLVLTSIASEC